jgi:nucleotide-binding universal stress UspA family protein
MLSHSDSITQVVNTLAGENIIKRALSFLRNAGVANIQSYLIEGDPADVILEAREKHQADTIVMGCRGTGKLKGLLMGSVSQSVAHSADCSVVIVK